MKIVSFSYLSFLLFVFVLSCSREKPTPPPETESASLNEMLLKAPISWINLKDAEVDSLLIPDNKIFTERFSEDPSLGISNPAMVKVFGDHLIVLEYSSPDVFVLDKDGTPVQKINGEFVRPTSIMSDGSSLYIYDDDLKKIYIYNTEFEFQTSLPMRNPYYTQGSVLMNQNHIAYQHEEASGFRVSDTDRKLLSVASKEQPDSTLFEAIPRIVPSGKQPGGFNNLLFSMNNNNEIVAAYPALPYLFVYRDFELQQNIVIEADQFETIENPSLTPFDPVFGEAVRVSSLINQIYLMDSGDILLFSFELLHHLKNNLEKGYDHHRSYALFRGDTGEQIQSISNIDAFPEEPTRFYATDMNVLFELNLPE
ncbi:hypothetical protein BH23BAC3_BH23BAC3_15140 [soil metagenome]